MTKKEETFDNVYDNWVLVCKANLKQVLLEGDSTVCLLYLSLRGRVSADELESLEYRCVSADVLNPLWYEAPEWRLQYAKGTAGNSKRGLSEWNLLCFRHRQITASKM